MRKILVVTDMQVDFISGALGSKTAEERLENAVKVIEDFEGDIIVTFDTHSEDYLETQEGKKLPVIHTVLGTKGWNLHNSISLALENRKHYVLVKDTFGSFDLEYRIQGILGEYNENKEFEVYLIGNCTDICVITNALILKTAFPEVRIVVIEKACTGTTKENHDAAIQVMRCCQIDIE